MLCAGRTGAKLAAVAEPLGDRALALELDLDAPRAVAALPGSLPEPWREVDILVNNAGHDVGGRQPFVDGDPAAWSAIVETNVNGLMRITHALLPGMIGRGRGHVVNVGSTAGLRGYAGGVAYAASKHAVHGFSESLRLDLAATGVRDSEILPGMVHTRFAYARWPDDPERASRFYREQACIEAADVARAVRYVVCEPTGVEIASLVIRPKGEG